MCQGRERRQGGENNSGQDFHDSLLMKQGWLPLRCPQGFALYLHGGPASRRLVPHAFGFVIHLSNCTGTLFIPCSVAQFSPNGLRERIHVNRFRVADRPEVHALLVPMDDRVAIG